MTTYTLTVSTGDLGLGVISGARVVVERKRTQVTDIFNGRSIGTNSTATNSSGIATALLEPDDGSVYHELKIFDLAGIPVYSKIFTMPPQDVAVTALPVQDIISSSASQAVAASVTATAQAVISTEKAVTATAQAVIATNKAVLAAADRVQTGLDVVATAADRVQTGLDRVQTTTDAATTIAARDAALLSSGLWPTTAAGIGNGVSATSGLVAGSGGTNGAFALAFSGGTQVIAPTGYFVVAGGVVTQVVITYKGYYSAGTPTISFAASSGLTGASVTAVMAVNTPLNQYFTVPSSPDSLILYKVTTGPAATEQTRYPSSTAINNIKTFGGKFNAWPDPFFRKFDLTSKTFLGKDRWWSSASAFTSVSRVANTVFNGYAIRRAADASTTPLNGPVIYLNDIGATTGDTITVYTLITGTSGTINCPGRFDNGTDSGWVGSQFTAVNATGGGTLTSPSSTPQWLRHSVTVPSGATRFVIYPYTTTPSVTFDIVAFWGGKGAVADIPDWPTQQDEFYYRLRDIDLTSQTTINTQQTAELDYMMTSYGVVTAATTATNLAVMGASTDATYSNPFTGWGERFTPAAISFNAIKIKYLGRNVANTTKKWRTINVVIRTGTNSHLTGSTVVAVGSVTVNPDAATLSDLTILLKDQSTGAVKTLTDADFSGSEYFIGIYAIASDGTAAGMSFPSATQSNTLSQSYYITTANAVTGTWSTNSGNNRVGVDHLLLGTPVESTAYTPTPAMLAQLAANLPLSAPTLVVPPKIYLLQGRERSVYFDNVILDDATTYAWDVVGATTGSQQNERYATNPTGAVTSHTAKLSVSDKRSGTALASASMTVVGVASSANSGVTKACLFIGDSLTQDGAMTQTLLDIAATDVMGISLIGTLGTGSNKHEGRGGWKVSDYATVGRTFYLFNVSGVTTVPQINSTEYTNNSSTFRVQEVAITAGSGTITCERTTGTNAPSASGTLTKSNAGIGDSTIAFSASSSVSGNPFWISSAVNFPQYLINNSLSTPDTVFIMLGINDVFSASTDEAALLIIDAELLLLDTLITSIKATNSTIKVVLMPPTPPSYYQDSFGTSYGVGQTRWRFKRNILLWAKQLYAKYVGLEASRVYICAANTNLDTVNNMQIATVRTVNSRSSITVARQNNGVHPALSGYQQLADAVWCFLKNN